jgi:hypothetical protein
MTALCDQTTPLVPLEIEADYFDGRVQHHVGRRQGYLDLGPWPDLSMESEHAGGVS